MHLQYFMCDELKYQKCQTWHQQVKKNEVNMRLVGNEFKTKSLVISYFFQMIKKYNLRFNDFR